MIALDMTALDPAARKVQPHHLEREACLYVRQSSPRQVRDNPESRACQYALQQRAVELGWPASRVRVIDDDLGQSGGDSQRRDGFKDLLARVSLGEVGIVMGLEVSRLARNNADWHRLLQLCALSDTLVLDGDGVYDPHDINDRLVLGLKGTMSEVELHTMRARLLGGARNKARRGELELALPTGLALREDGAVTLDPDASVVSAIGAVFATFRKAGSAHGTAKRLREDGVQLPRRPRSGPSKGEVTWVAPTGPRVNAILSNPRYAGAYVYGRTRSIRRAGRQTRQSLPPDQWQVLLPEAHPGYIDWPEYLRNRETLARNRAAAGFGGGRVSRPREGSALLQSRALCGRCGRALHVAYGNAGRHGSKAYYICKREFPETGPGTCLSMPAEAVDRAVARRIVETVNREHAGLALAAQDEIADAAALAAAARAKQLEGLRYEAERARRRFFAADPEHRLVAAPLEAEWNARLSALDSATREHERLQRRDSAALSDQARQRVAGIEQDFAALWDAPSTGHADRKRMLALLVEDATLDRDGYQATARLRFRGGRGETVQAELPRPVCEVRRASAAALAALDRLLDTCTDAEAAAALNRQGLSNWNGVPFHARRVRDIRRYYRLPSLAQRLADRGFVTARAMAARLGVCVSTVRVRARKGLLRQVRYSDGHQPKHLYAPLADEQSDVTETRRAAAQADTPANADSEE